MLHTRAAATRPSTSRHIAPPPAADRASGKPAVEVPIIVRWARLTAGVGHSRASILVVAVAMISAIVSVDYVTVGRLHLALVYLAPITMVGWFAGRRAGFGLAVVCTVLKFATDLASGHDSGTAIHVWDSAIRLGVYWMIVSEQGMLKEGFAKQHELARHDPLTGVANLRMFREEIQAELARIRRHPRPFTMAFIDLDDFKRINDRYGHKTGDAVLQVVSGQLRGSLRATDICARLGGDEFAILMPETNNQGALIVLSKLQHLLRADRPERTPRISASIGAVTFDRPPDSVDEVVARADQVMYAVKRRVGKDSIEIQRADLMVTCPPQSATP